MLTDRSERPSLLSQRTKWLHKYYPLITSFTNSCSQAREHDAKELFNRPLFNKLGELGMLGLTVPEKYGGAGLDATSVVIVHEELSTADPAYVFMSKISVLRQSGSRFRTWRTRCCLPITCRLMAAMSSAQGFCRAQWRVKLWVECVCPSLAWVPTCWAWLPRPRKMEKSQWCCSALTHGF